MPVVAPSRAGHLHGCHRNALHNAMPSVLGCLGTAFFPPPGTKSVSQDDTHNEPLDKQNMCNIKIPAAFLCSAVGSGLYGNRYKSPVRYAKALAIV